MKIKRFNGFLNEEKKYKYYDDHTNFFNKKDEISSYEHALILHLNTKHNIPDVIQWLNSEAKQFGCKAEFADDMVIITSSKGLAGDLTKFKNGFLGFENLDK